MGTIMNLLEECDNATFFHTPMWLSTVKHFWGLEWFYDVKTVGDKKAFMPMCVYTDADKQDFHFSTFKGYGGILTIGNSIDMPELLVIEHEFSKKYTNLKTRDNPLSPWQGFNAKYATADFGYMIDRRKPRRISNHHERAKKTANKYGLMCRPANSHEWHIFYEKCYLETVSSWREPSIIYKFSFFDYLRQFKGVELYITEYMGRIIAGIVTLSFGKHTHLWLSGISRDYRNMLPMYLLVNELIDHLLPDDITWVDMGVSGRNENILFFKKGFGGEIYKSVQYETSSDFHKLKKKLSDNYVRNSR